MNDEVHPLFARVIRAVQRGDRGIVAGRRRPPHFFRVHRVAGAELFVLYALRKHPAARPAPHFASDGVDDDEVVRFSTRERELDVFASDVLDAEREVNRARIDGYVEV
jgi:hypothetical protein